MSGDTSLCGETSVRPPSGLDDTDRYDSSGDRLCLVATSCSASGRPSISGLACLGDWNHSGASSDVAEANKWLEAWRPIQENERCTTLREAFNNKSERVMEWSCV